jgi:hypothetical protein
MTDGNTESISATARAPRRLVSAPSSPPDLTRRAFVATAAAAWIPCALAQGGWPAARPITWVVPYPAGGTTDILGRGLAPILATALGTPVVVDNKAGATGTIGGAFVARGAADGFTVLGTSIGPQAIAPHLMGRLSYDPLRDLEPVALIGSIPHLAMEYLTSAQAQHQLHVSSYRPFLSLLRGAQKHLREPPRFVNAELVFSCARLTDGLDSSKRIVACILPTHSPAEEHLGHTEQLPMSLGVHHPPEP